MSFKRQEDRMIGAGLNLAMPPDMVGAGQGICVQNWRVDAPGSLRSRQDAILAGYPSPGSSYIDQITRIGSDRYYLDSAAGTLSQQSGAGGAITVRATGLNSSGTGLVGYQNYVWIMNRASGKQIRYTTTGTSDAWTPAAPASAPTGGTDTTGGGLVEGIEYWYWVTFVRGDGYESSPSPRLGYTISAGNNAFTLTRPNAVGWTPSGWHVYRMGNTMGAPYRVTLTPVAYATTTWAEIGTEDFTDAEVTRRGIALEDDHDAAPACSGAVGPYFERILAWGNSTYSNRLYWTPARQPWYFRGPDQIDGDWVDVGELDEIVNVTLHAGHARIYCKRAIWRLSGDPATGTLERVSSDLGLIGRQAIATAGAIDYLQGQEGIYAFNGDNIRNIAPDVNPLFRNAVTYGGGAAPTAALNTDETYRAKNCLAVKNGRLFFSYCSGSNTSPDALLCCDLASSNWGSETTPTGVSSGYTSLIYEGQFGELLGTVASGAGPLVYALEQAYGSETKALKWISGYRNQGTSDRQKRYADLVVTHSVKRSAGTARSLTAKLKLDTETVSDLALGSLSVATTGAGVDRVQTILPVPSSSDYEGYEARNAAVLIEGNCEHEVVIFDARLHYYFEPRDAISFDTSAVDLGMPLAKSIVQLWLEINSTDTVTYKIYTDLPAAVMTSRATSTFAATSGRTVVPIDITGVSGRIVRLTLTSQGTFRLYQAKIKFRIVGTFIYGGQVWKTSRIVLA